MDWLVGGGEAQSSYAVRLAQQALDVALQSRRPRLTLTNTKEHGRYILEAAEIDESTSTMSWQVCHLLALEEVNGFYDRLAL